LIGILGNRYPSLSPFSHRSGHLWQVFLGIENSDMAFLLIYLASIGSIVGGLILMTLGWQKIHKAPGKLVTNGIYARVRHPQYLGIFLREEFSKNPKKWLKRKGWWGEFLDRLIVANE